MSYKAMRNFKAESTANKYNANQDAIKELIEDQEDELKFILNDFEREEEVYNTALFERNSRDQMNRYYQFRRRLFNNNNNKNEVIINPQLGNEDIKYCSVYEDEIIIQNNENDLFWGLKYLNQYDNEEAIYPMNWLASLLFEKCSGSVSVEFYIKGSLDWDSQLSKKERLMVVRRAKEFYNYARISFFKDMTITFSSWHEDDFGENRDKYYKKISEKIGFNYKKDEDYYSGYFEDTPKNRKVLY